MSSQEQQQDNGGRKRRHTEKRHNKKNTMVIGKVYADWCGHCQSLKPEWAKMKKRVYSKKGRKHVVFVEVEEKQIDNKLRKLEEEHGVKVEAKGYPTLFRIENGKVDYYNGNRQSDEMSNWYLRGGEPDQEIPGLMQDLQGGRRWRTKRRDSRNERFKKYPNTRRMYHPLKNESEPYATRKYHKPKKDSGMFSFLFGK